MLTFILFSLIFSVIIGIVIMSVFKFGIPGFLIGTLIVFANILANAPGDKDLSGEKVINNIVTMGNTDDNFTLLFDGDYYYYKVKIDKKDGEYKVTKIPYQKVNIKEISDESSPRNSVVTTCKLNEEGSKYYFCSDTNELFLPKGFIISPFVSK